MHHLIFSVLLIAVIQQSHCLPPDEETKETTVTQTISDLRPLAPRRWVALPANRDYGFFDHPAAPHNDDDHDGNIRRRQATPSITTPASSPPTDAYDYVDEPSFAPVGSDILASLSSLDSSIDAQVSSAMQDMPTGECVGVPDVNGTPVTVCGPTAASAPPTSASNTGNGAVRERIGAAIAAGLLGALML